MKEQISAARWLKKFGWLLLLMLTCVFIFPAQAQALYIDPGTGSIVIQVLLGALIGGLVALKMYFARVKAWFAKLFNRSSRDDESGK